MKRKDIEKILKEQKPFLAEKFFVSRIGVFGSYARDQHTENSDIDILVEFIKPVGFEFFDLKEYLESKTNLPEVKPWIEKAIQKIGDIT